MGFHRDSRRSSLVFVGCSVAFVVLGIWTAGAGTVFTATSLPLASFSQPLAGSPGLASGDVHGTAGQYPAQFEAHQTNVLGLAAGAATSLGLMLQARRRQSRAARQLRKTSSVVKSAANPGRSERTTASFASTVFSLLGKFNSLFSVWLALSAAVALKQPSTFLWIKSSMFTNLLGLLMLSVGVTTTVDDFKACFDRLGTVALNLALCYGAMPALAFALAKVIGANEATLAGMVLVGSLNGGQASNLCALIAGADVALSVLMTAASTLACTIMTPLLCKLVLGSVIAVDATGIMLSTLQVVIAPILVGVFLNSLMPEVCSKFGKISPTVGVVVTVLLVAASVAQCADAILGAGMPLQLACLGLHLIGGILGYMSGQALGYDVRTCRTLAIETSMKSSAFGFALARLHFGAFGVCVPPAVSAVWMAITGSALAAYWQGRPITELQIS